MAHTPVAPTGTPIEFNPTEITAFYLAEVADPLSIEAADLIPLTSGGDGFSPTRTVTRTPLHNLSDIVSVGALQGGDTTIDVYLPPSNEKMQLMRNSLKDGTHLIFNMWFKDGTGVAGYLVVTGVSPSTDDGQFSQTISVSTFNVNLIDAPSP